MSERICLLTGYKTNCNISCCTCDCGGDCLNDCFVPMHDIELLCDVLKTAEAQDSHVVNLIDFIRNELEKLAVSK